MSDFFNENDFLELSGELASPDRTKLEMNDYTFISAKKKTTNSGKELFEFNFRADNGIFVSISAFKNAEGKYNMVEIDKVLAFMATVNKIDEPNRAKLIPLLLGKRVALKFANREFNGKEYLNLVSVQRASDDIPF